MWAAQRPRALRRRRDCSSRCAEVEPAEAAAIEPGPPHGDSRPAARPPPHRPGDPLPRLPRFRWRGADPAAVLAQLTRQDPAKLAVVLDAVGRTRRSPADPLRRFPPAPRVPAAYRPFGLLRRIPVDGAGDPGPLGSNSWPTEAPAIGQR